MVGRSKKTIQISLKLFSDRNHVCAAQEPPPLNRCNDRIATYFQLTPDQKHVPVNINLSVFGIMLFLA